MRCLHVSAAYWPMVGGAEAYLQGLSERLVAVGHEVTVMTTDAASAEQFWMPGGDRLTESSEIHNGVSVLRHPLKHLPLSPHSFHILRRLAMLLSRVPLSEPVLWRCGSYMPWVRFLKEALDRADSCFDLVHAVNISFESLPLAALEYAQRRGIPFLLTPFLHTAGGEGDRTFRSCTMAHQWALLRRSSLVIVQTDKEKEILLKGGLDPLQVEKVGMAVEIKEIEGGNAQTLRLRHGLRAPVVAFLGRVQHDKGATHLVEAMRRLWHDGREVELVMAGPTMADFRGYYRSLPQDVRDRVRLLGALREEKKDLLAAADMLVVPSRVDSFGLVFLEAWAYRKPVIGAAAGGVPEVITEGVDGLLVPFGDVEALSQRITMLLDDESMARRLGEAGHRKVLQSYTWDVIFRRLEDIYRRVAG